MRALARRGRHDAIRCPGSRFCSNLALGNYTFTGNGVSAETSEGPKFLSAEQVKELAQNLTSLLSMFAPRPTTTRARFLARSTCSGMLLWMRTAI